jgi:membrane fusion protein (multidrug efflux system)
MKVVVDVKFPFYLVLMLLWVSACQQTEKQAESVQENEIRKLPVTSLLPKDIMLHHEYVADIQAIQNVEIRARIEGYLEKVYVDEGEYVKKGQPLFRINDEEYKSRLAKTKANLETAIAEAKAKELEVDRVKLLSDKKVISTTELEVAKARLKAARARVDEARSAFSNARIELSYTYIKAPFDGIIDRIPLKVGSLISEGTLLTTVSDNSSFYTYFNVSEKEYLQYVKTRLGNDEIDHDEVELILADGSKYPYKGKIQTMEGEFEEGTGSIAFRAHFPNPDKVVKHNSSGKIRLTNLVEDALFIPQKSVFSIQDKNFVYVVDEDNKVKMKSFDPKTRFSYFYLIEGGLEPGESIVYEGVQNIRDGITIEPLKVHMDSLVTRAPDLGATFY